MEEDIMTDIVVGPDLDDAIDDLGRPTMELITWCEDVGVTFAECFVAVSEVAGYKSFVVARVNPNALDKRDLDALIPLPLSVIRLPCPGGYQNCYCCSSRRILTCRGRL